MIAATIVGNVGKDAERSADGKRTRVNVASSHGFGDHKSTSWVSCTFFGKPAEWAAELRKGDKVAVAGKIYMREHEGKQYLSCDADAFERMERRDDKPASSGGGAAGSIPFAKEPSLP